MKTFTFNQTRLPLIASMAAYAIMVVNPSGALAAPGPASSTSVSDAQVANNQAPTERAEDRIKHLHDLLKITPQQEAQWSNVAQVMLNNASAVDNAIKDRAQKAKTMNAVDDLFSYQAIAATHAEGIKKLAIAFKPLYAAMPEEQQKNADAVFAHRTEPSRLNKHA